MSAPRRRPGTGPEPHLLSDSLDALARSLERPELRPLSRLAGLWEQAVGPTVARHSRPVRLDGDALVVEVDDPAWATQLRYLAAPVVTRLAEVEPTAAVARLEIRVRRPGTGPP